MSGLFQRIARRRSDVPDETAERPPAGAPQQPGADPAEQPTRYVGLPADAVGGGPGAGAAAGEEAADRQLPTAEQPTALFPLVPDQPTEAHRPPAAGAEPAAAGAAAAGAQPTAGAPAPAGATDPAAAADPAGASAAQAADGQQAAGSQAAGGDQPQPVEERRPGFRERGRMRRRLRYLRRLRELQVRDLGGLAFDLRRFERKRDDLVAQKIDQIRACDDELRALETALEERRDIRDVRMPGIGGTCPRCFSIYGSSDRFCSHCGAALGGLAQGPAQVAAPPPPPAPPAGAPSPPTSPPPAQ